MPPSNRREKCLERSFWNVDVSVATAAVRELQAMPVDHATGQAAVQPAALSRSSSAVRPNNLSNMLRSEMRSWLLLCKIALDLCVSLISFAGAGLVSGQLYLAANQYVHVTERLVTADGPPTRRWLLVATAAASCAIYRILLL